MGKWSQREYNEVLSNKVGELFEKAVNRIDGTEAGIRTIPDKRFRTFIKDLDPSNRQIQKAFQSLVFQQFFPGVDANQHSLRRVTSALTSMGPHGLPIPNDSRMPITYEPNPRTRAALNATRLQQNLRRSNTLSNLRRQQDVPRVERREGPIDFTLNDVIDTSPPPLSLSRERISRNTNTTGIPDFGITTRSTEPASPPNQASSSWLEEYNSFVNPQTQASESRRSVGPYENSLRPLFRYDSDATSVPDEFDTLLDRPSSPGNGNMIIGRRRRRISTGSDDEGDLHRMVRRPRREPMDEIRAEYVEGARYEPMLPEVAFAGPFPTESSTSSGNNIEGDNIGVGNGQDRDARRDGVVFDPEAMATLFEDILTPRADDVRADLLGGTQDNVDEIRDTSSQLSLDIEEFLDAGAESEFT